MAFSVEVILRKTKVSTKMFVARTYFKSCSKIKKKKITKALQQKSKFEEKNAKIRF